MGSPDRRLPEVDTLVLGAGIVGVSVAVNLAKRGLSVGLVDLQQPGLGASFGNGGLIQREGVFPRAFPRSLSTIFKYSRNNKVDMRYDPSALPEIAKFLYLYWKNSERQRYRRIVESYSKLIAHSVTEHSALAAEANAEHLIKYDGWTQAFRTGKVRDIRFQQADIMSKRHGVEYVALDAFALRRAEPHVHYPFLGAIRWANSARTTDPFALTTAYYQYFLKLGGQFSIGDARTLARHKSGWSVADNSGNLRSKDVVIASGAGSPEVLAELGYNVPAAAGRGYHMHYSVVGEAKLCRPLLDTEGGFFLHQMAGGLRLTTGMQFSRQGALTDPVQLDLAEASARSVFPVGTRLQGSAWMGVRPCIADMMPVIGRAPRHSGLWFAFGHGHHGFTLGPATGRLVADLVTKTEPFIDPAAFSIERFS